MWITCGRVGKCEHVLRTPIQNLYIGRVSHHVFHKAFVQVWRRFRFDFNSNSRIFCSAYEVFHTNDHLNSNGKIS